MQSVIWPGLATLHLQAAPSSAAPLSESKCHEAGGAGCAPANATTELCGLLQPPQALGQHSLVEHFVHEAMLLDCCAF